MSNTYFQFKQFTIHQDRCAMKVTTDACLFGAWAANKIKNDIREGKSMLDIGTGTGLLSLMIAQKFTLLIDAIEIDTAAASQATDNIHISPWKQSIKVIQGDIKNRSTVSSSCYDIVICNPPFYENDLPSPTHGKNIAHHSKELLLHEVVQIIHQSLTGDGQFFLLLPYKRMAEAVSLFKNHNLHITDLMLVRESLAHPFSRIIIAGKINGKQEERICQETEIIIRDDKQNYTAEFTNLLKDYYLYL